ncbi:DUF6221 family protein [Streptomyces sp. NPDC055642]
MQWLRAQLDEDERIARAASPGPWRANAEHDEVLAVDEITVAEGFALSGGQLRATVDHIAEHDPARVLREIDAKRKRLAALVEAIAAGHDSSDLASELLPLEALPYADRPGYRDDWRP